MALLESIPRISRRIAEIFIAETGADTRQFPTAGHLASWAGTSPGSNESAGHIKSAKIRSGNRYLKEDLGIAASWAARTKGTYYSAKYRRITNRRGPIKGIVALEHSDAHRSVAHAHQRRLLPKPGADYFSQRQPGQTKARALAQLRALGYEVTIHPNEATA